MFRGSAHVKPEEHMKLIGVVGGNSNAFTSFDQTVYVNTVPSNHLEMALYLEADRMASFKVYEDIYKTERKVVAEEWRIRQNRPYGTHVRGLPEERVHEAQLPLDADRRHGPPRRRRRSRELQEFFNTYYLPNNAIAGRRRRHRRRRRRRQLVKKYYGWIPARPGVEARRSRRSRSRPSRGGVTVDYRVPLPAVMVGWHAAAVRVGRPLRAGAARHDPRRRAVEPARPAARLRRRSRRRSASARCTCSSRTPASSASAPRSCRARTPRTSRRSSPTPSRRCSRRA